MSSRCCAAAARTTRCWSARPAWARPPSPRAWPGASRAAKCPRSCRPRRSGCDMLLAGTKYRGDFEQRLKGVLKQIRGNPDAILFIDEIHTLIGAGSARAARWTRPTASGAVLGPARASARPYTEYRGVFEKDHALSRRFQKIDVPGAQRRADRADSARPEPLRRASPPAWARPRSRVSWPSRWAWSCCASTCRNTWSAMPCRA